MGGGPRTFPGGVTKWQWKRMLLKKREESQKRQLDRQRRVFEMRERAEILAAHPELQQPWEKLTSFPPPLPPSSLQKQISALSSRFRKPGFAEDLWDHKDGPTFTGPNEENKAPEEEDNFKLHSDVSKPVSGSSSASSTSALERRTTGSAKGKKGKEVSPISKSMQDYLDSFETDPLGLSVEREKDGRGKRRW